MTTQKMNAIVSTAYGSADVLKFKQVDKPTPKADEVLIQVHATSVTNAHTAIRTGFPLFGRLFLGLTKPKMQISGTDFSGEVVATGADVKNTMWAIWCLGQQIYMVADMPSFSPYPKVKFFL